MGKFGELATFHRRQNSKDVFARQTKFHDRGLHVTNNISRTHREPFLVEIRNKYTKEIVDLEVGSIVLQELKVLKRKEFDNFY